MQKRKALKVAAIAASFVGLVALVLVLMFQRIVTFQMAMLMLVALLGLYFGFGVLIAVYRFVSRLQ
jgi:uncharacterized membrane protein